METLSVMLRIEVFPLLVISPVGLELHVLKYPLVNIVMLCHGSVVSSSVDGPTVLEQ